MKGSSARVSTIRSAIVVRQRFSGIPATDSDIISAQHFWTGGLVLNHRSGTIKGVAAIYNRYDYRKEARDGLLRWEARLRDVGA